MHHWRILVVAGDINAQEVDIDGVFLPHAVKQHHHLDAVVYGDGHVHLLDDGNTHTETQGDRVSGSGRGAMTGRFDYLSWVISVVDAQEKERLFLPSIMSMPVVLMVTPMPSGW